jgi:hypothetical protein
MRRLKRRTGRKHRLIAARRRLRDAAGILLASFPRLLSSAMLFGGMALAPAVAFATWEYLSRSPILAVKEVLVEGARRIGRAHVEDLVHASSGGNILSLDEDALIEKLERTGWVKEVEIKLIPPGTVVVRLTENQPAATVSASGTWMVDRDGARFRQVQPGERLPRPLLTGVAGPETWSGRRVLLRALRLTDYYRCSGMPRFDKLAVIHHDPARGYSLVTERHKMIVHLGHGRFREGIERVRFIVGDCMRKGWGPPAEIHAYVKQDKVVVRRSQRGQAPEPARPAAPRLAKEH